MPYRTSRTTPITPPSPFPATPGEWRVYYPYFTPDGIEVSVGSKTGLKDSYLHFSDGSWDGARQSCHSLYSDPVYNHAHTETVADKIFSHYERGTASPYAPVEKIRGYIDSYDTTTQEIVFVLEKTSTAYQVNIKSRG